MSGPSSRERREVVFIVGGHGGIGTALSLRLAARGATIVLAGRDGTAVRAAVETLPCDQAHAVSSSNRRISRRRQTVSRITTPSPRPRPA